MKQKVYFYVLKQFMIISERVDLQHQEKRELLQNLNVKSFNIMNFFPIGQTVYQTYNKEDLI